MSDSLQLSAGAARSQLKILRQEQADTLAERSRKPALQLLAGGMSASPGQPLQVVAGKPTEPSATLVLAVVNRGNATAHGLLMRLVFFDETVTVDGVPNITHVPTLQPIMPRASVYTIEIGRLECTRLGEGTSDSH